MDACATLRRDSRIRVADARSTCAVFLNLARDDFRVIRFDGCVVVNTIACDWIVEKVGFARIAVELKGADIEHAALQIEAALCYLKDNGFDDVKVGGLIVCTRYPRFDSTFQRIKQRIAKRFRAPIKVTSDARELSMEELVVF